VFKIKRGKDGKVLHYKAKWVVKGYLQQYSVDYDQTFTIVVKPIAFKALFVIAAYYNLKIEQMDIKTAFLYGPIDQELYIVMLKGYKEAGKVCYLKKAFYGLKQSF
jgi:hypothetical protein